jgi:succinylglutamic semialdehyde dehydrogenase
MPSLLRPGLVDVTGVANIPDEEVFGPLLQIIRVQSQEDALVAANDTKFGLAAGVITDDATKWAFYRDRLKAGILNWNRATTGAASTAPFGGPGLSGNHRPSAYYAADYCAWPQAGLSAVEVSAQSIHV